MYLCIMKKEGRYLFFMLLTWFVINLVSALFSPLYEDEGYYELYSEHLAWGYYDHPPMVALMIYLGRLFFGGALGVRFVSILLSTASCLIIWRIIDENKPTTQKITIFFILISSVVMFNIYGFITVPDSPLIFFSSLFLLTYKRYLQRNTWSLALCLGLCAAAMLYSKYHAILLMGLICLSNLKLLCDKKIWVAIVIGLLLFVPHIYWQAMNDFPSFRYHFYQRSVVFHYSYPLEYIPNQLLVFNPIVFGAFIYVLIKRRSTDLFEHSMKFLSFGFFIFFWLMTSRGHTEPHWTVVCVIPAVYFLYHFAQENSTMLKTVYRFVLPMSFLVLIFRGLLIFTPFFDNMGFCDPSYYSDIATKAGNRPVVFKARFQNPSLYHHYIGSEVATFECYDSHKTQFDLWAFDTLMHGREVYVCGKADSLSTEYQIGRNHFHGFVIDNFQSGGRLEVHTVPLFSSDSAFHIGDTLYAEVSIFNPQWYPIAFHHEKLPVRLLACFKDPDDDLDAFSDGIYDDIDTIFGRETLTRSFMTVVSDTISLEDEKKFAIMVEDKISIYNRTQEYFDLTVEK